MKTYLDCIPCFLRQTLEASRIAGMNEKLQKEIINRVCKLIPRFSLESTPPEMGIKIHRLIKKLTSNPDPYKEIKEKSQKVALEMYPFLRKEVEKAKDSLFMAIKIATAGNVIDFAINNEKKIEKELKDIENQEFAIFDYEKFKEKLNSSKNILYLADNAGEIVFDRILIEKISYNKKVYCGVRGAPVINDALKEDAKEAGIDKFAEIIPNGSDAPGTFLDSCSEEFKNVFFNADMIISKGQGNFESLYGGGYPIFFLLKVKCLPVSKELNVKVGSLILKMEV